MLVGGGVKGRLIRAQKPHTKRISCKGQCTLLLHYSPLLVLFQLAVGDGCRASGDNTCDFGFPVMNRPHGVAQFLRKV